jgi:hypothetical protein
MAVGDVYSGLSSIAAGAYLDIQPTGTVEAVIHNIYHEYDVQLELYDGTNSLVFDTDAGSGIYAKYAFHVKNALRIRVKNTHATLAKLIGYDGVVTHT